MQSWDLLLQLRVLWPWKHISTSGFSCNERGMWSQCFFLWRGREDTRYERGREQLALEDTRTKWSHGTIGFTVWVESEDDQIIRKIAMREIRMLKVCFLVAFPERILPRLFRFTDLVFQLLTPFSSTLAVRPPHSFLITVPCIFGTVLMTCHTLTFCVSFFSSIYLSILLIFKWHFLAFFSSCLS